jgi:hypothetical protein
MLFDLSAMKLMFLFFILKGFIALIRAGHTCSVTKLFLNTTNSQQYLTVTKDGFYTTKLRQ